MNQKFLSQSNSWISTQPSDPYIVFEPNEHGGRLKYFADRADAAYWDRLWDKEEAETDYGRYETGHLPLFLRNSFLQRVRSGARVLEAGCGLAWFTVAANSLGYKAEGVDFAPRVIERLRNRFPDMTFWVGDVRNLSDVADDTYDAVYSPGVCEHFEEGPEATLLEAHRVTKRGGFVFVSTPCFNSFQRFLYHVGAFRKAPPGEFYQYAFSPREMTVILRDIGFEVLDVRQRGTLTTLYEHIPMVAQVPLGPLKKPLAVALDLMPGLRSWGQSCLWTARKL
jgi:SAM-dependent methyltransferase